MLDQHKTPKISAMAWLGFSVTTLVLLFFIIIALFYRHRKKSNEAFKAMGVSGPSSLPLVGNMHQYMYGMDKFYGDVIKKYGKVAGYYEGRYLGLLVADADMLKQIQVCIPPFLSFLVIVIVV